MGRTLVALGVLALLSGAGSSLWAPATAAYDPDAEWQDLPAAEVREVLFYNGIACHSTAIIQQQRLNRRVWNDILVCMKDDMGWPEPAAEAYDLILDPLVANFGQDSPR